MTNKEITLPVILRARAWQALKATWPAVLAGSALIQLASYVLNQIVGAIPVVGAYLGILATAALMVPMTGLTSGVLGYFRGKPLTIDCVKSMFPHWSKVILLYLWEMLCLMGWMMLGMLPMIVGMAVTYMAEASDGTMLIGLLLMLAGFALMLVLTIRAALNYSMAQCILIDDPSTGVRDVLKKSKAMMRGCRWHYVKVSWPVFAVTLGAAFIITALTAALPAWLASLISSVMACFTGVFSYYFMPVMYEELRRIGR